MYFESDLPIIGSQIIRGGNRSNAPRVEIQQRADTESLRDKRERECLAFDMHMAKVIGECLHSFYKGHLWKVEVSATQGIAKISIPVLMGPTGCYIMPLDTYSTKHVMKAGGLILEYFGIPRSSLDCGLAQFVKARANPVTGHKHKFAV